MLRYRNISYKPSHPALNSLTILTPSNKLKEKHFCFFFSFLTKHKDCITHLQVPLVPYQYITAYTHIFNARKILQLQYLFRLLISKSVIHLCCMCVQQQIFSKLNHRVCQSACVFSWSKLHRILNNYIKL